MKRIAKCSRCAELYRAALDGHDDGVCPLCHELDRIADAQRRAAAARRRDLLIGFAAAMLLAGGAVGWMLIPGRASPPTPPIAVVELRTDPVAVAVHFDEHWIGASSVDGRLTLSVPHDAATHWLAEFQRDGYVSQRRPVTVADAAAPILVKLKRAPLAGDIASDPPGAAVWIDGRPHGVTPLSARLAVDDLNELPLRLAKDGFEPVERVLPLPPPGTPLRFSVNLRPAAPRIAVTSEPPGATILRDGRILGKAPTTLMFDPVERGTRIVLQGELAGFAAAQTEVQLSDVPGSPVDARLRFSPPATRLLVQSDPPGARLTVNGRAVGAAPQRVELSTDDLRRPLTIEAALGRTHFGRRVVDPPPPGANDALIVRLAMTARRIVVAVDFGADAPDHLWDLRERIKDDLQTLTPQQSFRILAHVGDDAPLTPAGQFLAAGSEQKIRAYDFVDRLRSVGRSSGADAVLKSAAAVDADVVWFYLAAAPDPSLWTQHFPDAARPAIHLVCAAQPPASPDFSTWLAARHGSVEPLAQAITGVNPADNPADEP